MQAREKKIKHADDSSINKEIPVFFGKKVVRPDWKTLGLPVSFGRNIIHFRVKYRPNNKDPPKLPVWLLVNLSSDFTQQNNASGEIYRDKRLKALLIGFVELQPLGRDVLFWPDLTSAHFAR